MALFEPIFATLNGAQVRYVVVGGVATVLHGFARLTADLDLAIDLAPAAARRAIEALTSIGLRPRAPVDPIGFADPETRRTWMREKAMRVFSMSDPANPLRQVDLFCESPINFDELWSRAEPIDLGNLVVHVASIPDLIHLKRLAGRPQDLADIEALDLILKRKR